MDFAEAIKRQGLEYIGQGESVKQSAGFLKDIIDIKLLSRASKYGTRLKEKTLYPISRLLYPQTYSEFLEEGPGLSFFPENMRDKTKFGRYLDAIKQTRINRIPDSELYIDKKGDLYEWGGGEDINKIIYDKEDFGFLEGPDKPLNVQRVYEMKLESAKPKVERLKRALARDIDRRYEGKREGVEDVSWPDVNLSEKDRSEIASGGEFVDRIESDEKFKREVMSKKLFESLQAATDYDNWKHNLGSKAFTSYDLQDLENEIKLIESLSYKDIRKVCSETIEKFINGEEVTFDDIYNDLVSLMGTAPLPKNVLPDEPKFRTVAEQFQKRVDLLPGAAPTVATLGLERAVNLGETAALAKFVEWVPDIGGPLSTGISWVGGTVGAVGAGAGAVAGIGLFAVIEITKIIVRKILSISVDKLASQKTSIAEAANDVKEECIEELKEQKQEIIDEQQKVLKEAKEIRIAANEGKITKEERDELLQPLATEALQREKEAVILDSFAGAMEEDQKEKYPMHYELIDSDSRIKVYYTIGTGKNKKRTTATISRYVDREDIEDWKKGNEKNISWLFQRAKEIDNDNRKKGYKRAGPNPAKVAYFELKYGVKLPTIDPPKTENLIIQPDDIEQIVEKNKQTNQELQELNSIQSFDFSFGNPLAPLETKKEVPPAFDWSAIKEGTAKLIDNNYPTNVAKIDKIDTGTAEIAEFEEELPLQLKRKPVSLGKSDTTRLIKRPRDYSELEVPEGFFSNAVETKIFPKFDEIDEVAPAQVSQLKRKQVSLGKSDIPRLVKAPDSEKMPKRKRTIEEILPIKHSERKKKLKSKHKRARNTEPAVMPVGDIVMGEQDINMEEPRMDPEVSAFAADQGLFIIIIFR